MLCHRILLHESLELSLLQLNFEVLIICRDYHRPHHLQIFSILIRLVERKNPGFVGSHVFVLFEKGVNDLIEHEIEYILRI